MKTKETKETKEGLIGFVNILYSLSIATAALSVAASRLNNPIKYNGDEIYGM